MTQPTATPAALFAQILDPAHRPRPYPLYAQLRETPVAPLDDGYYAASTYAAVNALLHDPRMSKEQQKSDIPLTMAQQRIQPRPFLQLDPPEHDRLRRLTVAQFTPARVAATHGRIVALVDELLDAKADAGRIDIVDDLAYPLPVTIICELLGVPREDEPRFRVWVDALADSLDPDPGQQADMAAMAAAMELAGYMRALVAAKRVTPTDDLVSGLAASGMDDPNLIMTLILLLIAGHETTVNLIGNGTLTLLRNPDEMERLREDPERAPAVVEEVLRFEPPVQFANRFALADLELTGATIPKGAGIRVLFAAANRDPARFADPDRFDPDRPDNEHLGFSGGAHYCLGAPLARLEGQIALAALARRLGNPRLEEDPPPYRPNAILRGPRHLPVAFDELRD